MNLLPRINRRPLSLVERLLGGLVLPLAALAIALGIGGSIAIHNLVETVNDRILGAAARGIVESLAVEEQKIQFNLPVSAFAMLENNARDNIFYAIRYNGRVITGYSDLPNIVNRRLSDGDVEFGSAIYRGEPVRIVTEARRLPHVDGLVAVQVAETLTARQRLERQMLLALAGLELSLILLSALAVPLVVRWGIWPLRRLRADIDSRTATDLAPLSVEDVPRELKSFVGAFNGLLTRLGTATDGLTHFTADASHQMRTSLAILRTHLSVLKRAKAGSVEAAQSMADLDAAIERLQHLLVQLLALARADAAGSKRVELEPIDLGHLAQDVTAGFAGEAIRKRIDLQFDRDENVSLVAPAHPVLARELLSNLIDNAIRYGASSDGYVIVEVRRRGRKIIISVDDSGPGIPPCERDLAFDRFKRLSASAAVQGSGLGLPIVRALGHAMSAHVQLEDGRGGCGLRAVVSFPSAD